MVKEQKKEMQEMNEDEEYEEEKPKLSLTVSADDIDGLEDYDKDEDVTIEMKFTVLGKSMVEKKPEETEDGEIITDTNAKPKYKIKLGLISSEILNLKEDRKRAKEMGLTVDDVNEIKSRKSKNKPTDMM